MRVVFVQTYPLYHDLWSTPQWLAIENRDRWMPAIVADMGHDVELWAVGDRPLTAVSRLEGFHDYPVRVFAPSRRGRRTKFDHSDTLIAHARAHPANLYVLKGVDGGVGVRLVEEELRPRRLPFVFVIGGKFFTRHVPRAAAVLYETERQRRLLERPRWPWRRAVAPGRLVRLPKMVDLNRFRPVPGVEKRWDVLAIGRLVARYKNYDPLGALPQTLKIGVAGGGPARDALSRRFPWIDWLGQVSHRDIPRVLNQTRVFVHTGLHDFYPRVLAEAAACGVPSVAFENAIDEDVLPPDCGLRLAPDSFSSEVAKLLADGDRLSRLASGSRAHAERTMSAGAQRQAIAAMLRLVEREPADNTSVPGDEPS